MGLHRSDDDISSENKPIIHPPPTENDMAPTRSVLDVLKEISRKRINSDVSFLIHMRNVLISSFFVIGSRHSGRF